MIIAIGAFDRMDVFPKSVLICTAARNRGFVPESMSAARMNELKEAFNL